MSYPQLPTLKALHLDFERLDFLSQGIAVNAQHLRGDRLVACGSIQDNFEHRPLDVLDHHVVDGARLCSVEVLEVPLQRPADAIRDLARLLHFPAPLSPDFSFCIAPASEFIPTHAAGASS